MAGIAGVVARAELLVNSAVSIMHTFGISEKFIGLTIVALGTSLPELATSVVAAIKKEMDISETFAKLSLFVISTEGRNLNGLESLRFLVVNTPRNNKIQRFLCETFEFCHKQAGSSFP